ncbi:MAG: hypothetical protein F6K37_02495 [Moorea sp. SIO4E2]|nr:hypothetical protein [Moorena sp. SIO4E2]NEQ04894.1 hypothetical protein [Moorena sp. SIO4E2]
MGRGKRDKVILSREQRKRLEVISNIPELLLTFSAGHPPGGIDSNYYSD